MWRSKPLSSIELRQLRYFLAAVEHGSFRKAGIALTVQQSSVSRRIRDLEDQLGASLFRRHSGGIELTVAGRNFLEQTRAAMKHLGDGVIDVGSIGRSESGHLSVGIFSSMSSGFLHELFEAYVADFKSVRIDFSDGHPNEHIAAVRMHQIDVAFVTGTAQHAECETAHLWSEQIFAVLPSTHHLATRPSLLWSDLIGNTFIVSEQAPGREVHDYLLKHLSDLGQYPDVYRQNVGRDNLMSLVAIGRGLTLTSQAMTSTSFHGLVYRPVEGETMSFSAVWSPKNDNPALRRLLGMARALRSVDQPIAPSAVPLIQTGVGPSRTRDRSP